MPPPARLLAIFRAARECSDDPTPDAVLQAALSAYLEAARSAQLDFGIAEEEFVRYLAARTPPGKPLDGAHAAEMWLACACALGSATAIDAFRRDFGPVISRVFSSRRAPEDLADDAAQRVYEQLFVAPPGGRPKIAEYKGSGPLRSWVATVAARTLLMARRAADRRREASDSAVSSGLMAEGNPELLYMKARYKAEVEGGVARALQRLGDRERTLLRLHLAERLTIDQLAAMYAVNRATAARWVTRARESLVALAHEELRAKLQLKPNEWDSVVALVRSEVHVSIARRLGA